MTIAWISADQQVLQQKIEEKTGGHLHVQMRPNLREEQIFYLAYVLPPGASRRIPPDLEKLDALSWAAAETLDEALTRLGALLNIDLRL